MTKELTKPEGPMTKEDRASVLRHSGFELRSFPSSLAGHWWGIRHSWWVVAVVALGVVAHGCHGSDEDHEPVVAPPVLHDAP
jgi:hypothetical protein